MTGRPTVVAVALILLSAASALSVAQEPSSEAHVAFELFVRDFEPAQRGNTMDPDPPGPGTPRNEACTACAPAPLVYEFLSRRPSSSLIDIATDQPGRFEFWVRFNEAQPLGLASRHVTVYFELAVEDGAIVGRGQSSATLNNAVPRKFESEFLPEIPTIPAHARLTWTVRIETGPGSYDGSIAAYGSTSTYPFRLALVRIMPIEDLTLRVVPLGPERVNATTGDETRIPFRVENHGSRATSVRIELGAISDSLVQALQDVNGAPVEGPLGLEPGQVVDLATVAVALREGDWPSWVQAYGSRGDKGYRGFLVHALNDTGPPTAHDEAADALRCRIPTGAVLPRSTDGVPLVSIIALQPLNGTVECTFIQPFSAVRALESSLHKGGRIEVAVRTESATNFDWSVDHTVEREQDLRAPNATHWVLEARFTDFAGAYHLRLAGAADAAGSAMFADPDGPTRPQASPVAAALPFAALGAFVAAIVFLLGLLFTLQKRPR